MRRSTEAMSIKEFMNRGSRKSTLEIVLHILLYVVLPIYSLVKYAFPYAVIAFETIPDLFIL